MSREARCCVTYFRDGRPFGIWADPSSFTNQELFTRPIDCARQSGIRTLNRRRVVDQLRKKEIEWNRSIGFKMVEQEVEDGVNEFG